jgi:hypothetical protein
MPVYQWLNPTQPGAMQIKVLPSAYFHASWNWHLDFKIMIIGQKENGGDITTF